MRTVLAGDNARKPNVHCLFGAQTILWVRSLLFPVAMLIKHIVAQTKTTYLLRDRGVRRAQQACPRFSVAAYFVAAFAICSCAAARSLAAFAASRVAFAKYSQCSAEVGFIGVFIPIAFGFLR